MINEIYKDTVIRMEKCIDTFRKQINKIHAGRASPNLFDFIQIDCYGKLIPLRQLANITVEDSHTLIISVFDRMLIPSVEKSIISSGLGLNPITIGSVIRILLPALTEERRRNLIKLIRIEAEQSKVSVRNVRRYANDKVKILLKERIINKDKDRNSQNEIQKLTHFWIKKIDDIVTKKETELMKI